jgi:hypothetical protein
MKPSRFNQQTSDNADLLAADLAADMLSYIAAQYEHADDSERIELILRYGPVMYTLQRVISKAARQQQRRSNPGRLETK